MQPLSDVLVLDFTTLLPGPLATLLLAEAGAEVFKIELTVPEGINVTVVINGVPLIFAEEE